MFRLIGLALVTTLVLSLAVMATILGPVVAEEAHSQYRMKKTCEQDLPREAVCVVAYLPIELVPDWGIDDVKEPVKVVKK